MRLVYITLARKILCYGSFPAKVSLGTNAYNSLICNVNQECMFRCELLTSGTVRNVNEVIRKEVSITHRERKLRKTGDETNRTDTSQGECA